MRARTVELVLSLMLAACSAEPRQITLPPLPPRGNGAGESEFDNPGSIFPDAGADASFAQSDAGFGTDSCVDGLVRAIAVPPKVVLVLDGSCSMSTDYPANGAQSASRCTRNANGRWTALRNALVGQQGVVPKLDKAIAFGLVVYGTQPRCPIPGRSVDPALGNSARIQAGLPQVQPGMNTPTGPALDWVYDNMITAPRAGQRGAPQIVILATDGEPNSCGGIGFGLGGNTETNYQPSIDAVKKGTSKGATTYVISLADAVGPFHDHLKELANLGDPSANGSAKLYEPASPDQLTEALATLAAAALSCEIELGGAILLDRACDGMITLGGKPLTCNDPDGWAPIDERHIRLQGKACDELQANTTMVVEAKFACTGFRPD